MNPHLMTKLLKREEADVSDREDVKVAARQLFNRMNTLAQSDARDGANFYRTIQRLRDLIKSHRDYNRYRGVPFPKLVLLTIPRLGAVEVVRDDLDWKSVQILVVNLTEKYPAVTATELAICIGETFPQFRPGAQQQVNVELRRKKSVGEAFLQ